ncbi:MAG: exodeoxyribonuclease VII small subunit [Butyrivibrio sp.]|jgi:exodeoxyribonuclease VII small subunit|nr:exodeoxyribonuclease VII small subunit [Butyrivibrio sp.]
MAAKKEEKAMTVEQAFEEIEKKISLLEKEDVSLEDSFRFYQEGMKLLKYCNDSIDKVEKKVQKISSDGKTEDFE